MVLKCYAHSVEGEPLYKWQLLDNHIKNVSNLASNFATNFEASNWAKLAGRFHDFGKCSREWQAYLRHVNGVYDEFSRHYTGHVEHSIQGAEWLFSHSKEAGRLLAYCIAGHHGGLSNWIEDAVSGFAFVALHILIVILNKRKFMYYASYVNSRI